MRQRIVLLGATGSIGTNTLDVISRHPDRYEVFALTGNRRTDILFEQCRIHRPHFAVTGSAGSAKELDVRLRDSGVATDVLYGEEGLVQVVAMAEVDTVLAAIVGAAGLIPTLAAVRAGKRVLLANKESLVMAGHLFMAEVARSGTVLLPVDSEHNAIYQCINRHTLSNTIDKEIRRIILTASGGPFRTLATAELKTVTSEQACTHPNWIMGRKISVDSATLMNKGLEVIEARWLFDILPERIDVVVHPQSVVHSMVEYIDGSTLAQLGVPDMRTPIAYALAWPERINAGVAALDLVEVAQLSFERPDRTRFPCLGLAYQVLRAGDDAAAVLNAANEVAVDAFLAGQLPFTGIADVIAATLDAIPSAPADHIDLVLDADRRGRETAGAIIRRGSLNA